MMFNDFVQVKNNILQDEMYYKNTLVLSYKIEYPQFISVSFQKALIRINEIYKMKALAYQNYCRKNLYNQAVALYEDSVANGFPIRAFDSVVAYEVTYNMDCTLSLYFDKYEFMGGAHGNTIRSSDTWNLQNGRRIMLSQMFARSVHYKAYIMQEINNQIAKTIANGENIYFEDYEKNVAEYFNPESFYLTQAGVIIYYQQYEIAPYSTGIPEFTIPYTKGIVRHPRC